MHSQINPPLGICLNVLLTAARHGDSELASEVFTSLGNRKTTVGKREYKLLLEAYVRADMISMALSVLSIMTEAGLKPDDDTTSPLFAYINEDPDRLESVLKSLRTAKEEGKSIPIQAIDCLIRVSSIHGHLDRCLDLYQNAREVCADGPRKSTFDLLFLLCSELKRKDIAIFLVSEMLKYEIKPDQEIYSHLINICLANEDTSDALRYYDETKRIGLKTTDLGVETIEKLAVQLAAGGDQRAWDILDEISDLPASQLRTIEQAVSNVLARHKDTKSDEPDVADSI